MEKETMEKETNSEDVYFLKINKIRYLKSINYKNNCCQICGKKRKTTAHHIIPKRLHCICPFLSEIRIRVCDECDLRFHPENRLIRESDIIRKQTQNISNLKDAIYWRDNKIRSISKGMKESVKIINTFLNLRDEDFYKVKCQKIIKKEDKRKDE